MQAAALHESPDLLFEKDTDKFARATEQAECAIGQVLGAVVGGILEAVALEPIDGAKAIKDEVADGTVVQAVGDQIDAFLVDEERERLDDERLATTVDAVVANA